MFTCKRPNDVSVNVTKEKKTGLSLAGTEKKKKEGWDRPRSVSSLSDLSTLFSTIV